MFKYLYATVHKNYIILHVCYVLTFMCSGNIQQIDDSDGNFQSGGVTTFCQ